MRLSKRVGRAEELILLLDRSLALLESQMHRLLFQSPRGGAAPKPRPGSGKSASSSQKRPLGRFQRTAAQKAAKRKTAGHGRQIQDDLEKMAERVSRLQKQMRNLEKALRQHHLIDGALSESEPSEMD